MYAGVHHEQLRSVSFREVLEQIWKTFLQERNQRGIREKKNHFWFFLCRPQIINGGFNDLFLMIYHFLSEEFFLRCNPIMGGKVIHMITFPGTSVSTKMCTHASSHLKFYPPFPRGFSLILCPFTQKTHTFLEIHGPWKGLKKSSFLHGFAN